MEQGKRFAWLRAQSPAMIVAIIALVLATGGTAVAASKLVSGDGLIKKKSLSGNRLKNSTVSSTQIKNGAVGTTKLAALPAGRVRSNANQSIANSTLTPLTFNVVDNNVNGVYNASQPTRLTATASGTYLVTAGVSWANDAAGSRQLGLRVNGTTMIANSFEGPAADSTLEQNVATTVRLNAGDYVNAVVWQNCGSALDSWWSPNDAPVLTLNWIAP